MKSNEFAQIYKQAEQNGVDTINASNHGDVNNNFTVAQLQRIIKLAIAQGKRPNKRGVLKFGNNTVQLAKEDCDAILKEDNERKEVEEMAKQETKNDVVKVEVNTDSGIDAATEKKVNSTVAKIEKKIGTIEKGYLSIIGDVAYLAENNAHKVTGHKNLYELCKDKFGMARGTVHNLLAIYEHFGENYALKDEYKDMSLRKMLEQIKNEKDASKLLEAGEDEGEDAGEGEGEGEGEDSGKKTTKRTNIVDFNFANAEKWTIDELFDHIREELESAGINEVEAMTTITFKLDV